MKQAISKRLSAVIAVTMLLVLLLNLFLQIETTKDNMERNAHLMITQIEEILRSQETMDKNSIADIFSNLAVQEGVIGLAVDANDGLILGSTMEKFRGMNAADIRVVIPVGYQESFIARIDGVVCRCLFVQYEDLWVGVSWDNSVLYRSLPESMLLVFLYLAVAALILLIAIQNNLDHLVIDNINTINEKLEEITAGKLDTQVNVTTLPEFVSLSSHINTMTDSLLNHTVKISRILDASESQIGFFEYSQEKQAVFATRKVATILAISPEEMDRLCEDRRLFEERLAKLSAVPVHRYKNVYALPTETACYVKIETYVDEKNTFGVVMDVTEEFMERVRLRHERDHDLLTQLNSRRAFYRCLDELFAAPDGLGHAVMLMCDLDGLKGINDTYGHAGGDKAIRESANILTGVEIPNKIVARLSGDEFAVFIYGADSRECLQKHIDALYRNMMRAEITVFDRTVPIRLSGGYVFYPEYSGGYTDLLRMADQALYYSKGSGKARFTAYGDACAQQETLYDDVQRK